MHSVRNKWSRFGNELSQDMGIDDESSHPGLRSEVTHDVVSLFREPDVVTPPVRFDKPWCGKVEW